MGKPCIFLDNQNNFRLILDGFGLNFKVLDGIWTTTQVKIATQPRISFTDVGLMNEFKFADAKIRCFMTARLR